MSTLQCFCIMFAVALGRAEQLELCGHAEAENCLAIYEEKLRTCLNGSLAVKYGLRLKGNMAQVPPSNISIILTHTGDTIMQGYEPDQSFSNAAKWRMNITYSRSEIYVGVQVPQAENSDDMTWHSNVAIGDNMYSTPAKKFTVENCIAEVDPTEPAQTDNEIIMEKLLQIVQGQDKVMAGQTMLKESLAIHRDNHSKSMEALTEKLDEIKGSKLWRGRWLLLINFILVIILVIIVVVILRKIVKIEERPGKMASQSVVEGQLPRASSNLRHRPSLLTHRNRNSASHSSSSHTDSPP